MFDPSKHLTGTDWRLRSTPAQERAWKRQAEHSAQWPNETYIVFGKETRQQRRAKQRADRKTTPKG